VLSSNYRPPTHRLATIHERNQPTTNQTTNIVSRHDTIYGNMRLLTIVSEAHKNSIP